jgi:hypothetical protein
MLLTPENYSKGFLVDEELMGGVTANPDQPGNFVAFVLRHTTGEYLGYQPFSDLDEALATLNRVSRPWTFEMTSGCGGGNCGNGACGKGACGSKKSAGGGCC